MALKRKLLEIPDFVMKALEKEHLTDRYYQRPPYQRNDYIMWITGAKREETKKRRLAQMIDELKKGGMYMNMKHNPSK